MNITTLFFVQKELTSCVENRCDEMAEALAVVGIVANIIQLVDFGSRVLKRLKEYRSKLGDIPEVFRHIKAELPVLLDALRQTKAAIDAGYMQDDSRKALITVVEECGIQIQPLDDVTVKALPVSGDSWPTRPRSAVMASRPSKEDRLTSYTNKQTTVSSHSISPISGRLTYLLHHQADYS